MKTILKSVPSIYFNHFGLFLKMISPIFIPIILLRIVLHYSYLGQLGYIYMMLFGIILGIVSMFVEIILIRVTYTLLTQKTAKILLIQEWQNAAKSIWSYIYIKIIITLIVVSLPFFLTVLIQMINPDFMILSQILTIGWFVSFGLIFMFAPFALVIENQRRMKALERSANLFISQPFKTAIIFIILAGVIGAIFILLSTFTTIIISFLTGTQALFFNQYFSFWWERLTIDIFATLSLPLLIIIITVIFKNLQQNNQIINKAIEKK